MQIPSDVYAFVNDALPSIPAPGWTEVQVRNFLMTQEGVAWTDRIVRELAYLYSPAQIREVACSLFTSTKGGIIHPAHDPSKLTRFEGFEEIGILSGPDGMLKIIQGVKTYL